MSRGLEEENDSFIHCFGTPSRNRRTLSLDPEPSTSGADIFETSIVESGGPLPLNPFPSEDEPDEGAHYTRSTVETETVSQVTTEAYVHVPAQDMPTSASGAKAAKKAPRKKVPSKDRP